VRRGVSVFFGWRWWCSMFFVLFCVV
jgi:hypothetical protein